MDAKPETSTWCAERAAEWGRSAIRAAHSRAPLSAVLAGGDARIAARYAARAIAELDPLHTNLLRAVNQLRPRAVTTD